MQSVSGVREIIQQTAANLKTWNVGIARKRGTYREHVLQRRGKAQSRRQGNVHAQGDSEGIQVVSDGDLDLPINNVTRDNRGKFTVSVRINNKVVVMEVDSGAANTVMGMGTFQEIFRGNPPTIVTETPILRDYQNGIIETIGESDEDLQDKIVKVLDRFREDGLHLRKDKCVFYTKQITFLGFEISAEGLKPTQDKVKAIYEAPAPTNKTELQAFLGNKISNADALSRLPLKSQERRLTTVADVLMIENVPEQILAAKEIAQETVRDPVMSKILQWARRGWPEETNSFPKEFQPYFRRKNEITVYQDCLLWGSRVIIPPGGRKGLMNLLHEGHPGVVKMKAIARSYAWWPKLDEQIEEKVKSCGTCQQTRNMPRKAINTLGNGHGSHGHVCR
nr:unnamed protein product [Callosobruchus analis]